MNEINPVKERNIKLEDWFIKVEQVLTDNFEVVGKLLVPVIRDKDIE